MVTGPKLLFWYKGAERAPSLRGRRHKQEPHARKRLAYGARADPGNTLGRSCWTAGCGVMHSACAPLDAEAAAPERPRHCAARVFGPVDAVEEGAQQAKPVGPSP